MGQAKARGDFKQRQAAAIERAKAERIAIQSERDARKAAERAAEAALPEPIREQRRAMRHRRHTQTALIAGVIAALGPSYRGTP
jgi:ferric-dicitrate binding protein FerR (iron transport regulator)